MRHCRAQTMALWRTIILTLDHTIGALERHQRRMRPPFCPALVLMHSILNLCCGCGDALLGMGDACGAGSTLTPETVALVEGAEGSSESAHVIPHSLLSLQAQMQTFWETVNVAWADIVTQVPAPAPATAPGAGPAPATAPAPAIQGQPGLDGLRLDDVMDIMHASSFLATFRSLGDQVAALGWRVASILQKEKEHPDAQEREALLPSQNQQATKRTWAPAADLYAQMPVV